MFYTLCYKNVKIMGKKKEKIMGKKKEVKYFIGDFDRINEGLKNRNIDADAVINILHLAFSDNAQKPQVIVYYKE